MDAQEAKAFFKALREQRRAEHAEDLIAIERVERMFLFPVESPAAEEQPIAEAVAVAPTLIGSIQQVFETHPERSWSARSLEKQLRSDDFKFEAKNPLASINTALARLIERQGISLYKRGSGRKPSLYKTLPSGNLATLRGRMAAMGDRSLSDGDNPVEVGQVGEPSLIS